MTSPEVTAAARAVRDTLISYTIIGKEPDCIVAQRVGEFPTVFEAATRQECQQWIDCQAFAAGLQAMLPVSDGVRNAMSNAWMRHDCDGPGDSFAVEFTAAINHITQRNA